MASASAPAVSRSIAWIDRLKAIGIVLVVLGHAVDGTLLHEVIYSFHMPLFFFASGYLFSARDAQQPLAAYLRQRIAPYLRYYLVFSLVGALYYIVVKHWGPDHRPLAELLLNRAASVLAASGTSQLPGLAQASTVWPIALWFFPALAWGLIGLKLSARRSTAQLGALACAAYALGKLMEGQGWLWSLDAGMAAYPYLVLGQLMRRHLPVEHSQPLAARTFAWLLVALALGAVTAVLSSPWSQSAAAWLALKPLAFATIVLPGVVALTGPGKARAANLLARSSLMVFPLHIVVFSVVDNLTRRSGPLQDLLAYGEPAGIALRVLASFAVLVPLYRLMFERLNTGA